MFYNTKVSFFFFLHGEIENKCIHLNLTLMTHGNELFCTERVSVRIYQGVMVEQK